MVQNQGAGVPVLGGDLHLGVQPLQHLGQIAGVAVHGDGFGVGLGVHPHLILAHHVQQVIVPPVAVKVPSGDAAGVVREGELIDLIDARLIQGAVGVLLHRYGIMLLRRQRREEGTGHQARQRAQQQAHMLFHENCSPFTDLVVSLSFDLEGCTALRRHSQMTKDELHALSASSLAKRSSSRATLQFCLNCPIGPGPNMARALSSMSRSRAHSSGW